MQIQLLPTDEQKRVLLETMRICNAAANVAAKNGFASRKYSRPALHTLCYKELRETFGMSID